MDMTMESCRKFVEVLASNAPAPGGGGAAALVGAIGTAMTLKIYDIHETFYLCISSNVCKTIIH